MKLEAIELQTTPNCGSLGWDMVTYTPYLHVAT